MSVTERRGLSGRLPGVVHLRSVVAVSSNCDAARLGRWLMGVTGVVLVITGWIVDPEGFEGEWRWILVTAGPLLLMALGTGSLPWDRWPRRATIAYPVLALALLGVVGLLSSGAGSAYVPTYTLWFVYVGATQTAGTSWFVAPLSAAVWVLNSWPMSAQKSVRLALVVIVWALVADIVAVRAQQFADQSQDLSHQAETDPLTGLANRRALLRVLATLRHGDAVAVIDIDHFKQVNDTWGHDAGDKVLVALAELLSSAVRSGDLAARLGGEEFVLLLRRPQRQPQDTDGTSQPLHALDVLDRLRADWSGEHPTITWSAGVCVHRAGDDPELAMSRADQALYAAKHGGRDQVVACERSAQPVARPA